MHACIVYNIRHFFCLYWNIFLQKMEQTKLVIDQTFYKNIIVNTFHKIGFENTVLEKFKLFTQYPDKHGFVWM